MNTAIKTDLQKAYDSAVNSYLEQYTDNLLDIIQESSFGEYVGSLGYNEPESVEGAVRCAKKLVRDHLQFTGVDGEEVERLVNQINKSVVLDHISVDYTRNYRNHDESVFSLNMGEEEIDLSRLNDEFMVEQELTSTPDFFAEYGYYPLNDHVVHAVLDLESITEYLTMK
jgi:hypothetical protein